MLLEGGRQRERGEYSESVIFLGALTVWGQQQPSGAEAAAAASEHINKHPASILRSSLSPTHSLEGVFFFFFVESCFATRPENSWRHIFWSPSLLHLLPLHLTSSSSDLSNLFSFPSSLSIFLLSPFVQTHQIFSPLNILHTPLFAPLKLRDEPLDLFFFLIGS